MAMSLDRRQMLAQALMGNQQQANNGTFAGALASALAGGLAGYQMKQIDAQKQSERMALAKALAGGDAQKEKQLSMLPAETLQNVSAERLTAAPSYKTVGDALLQIGTDGQVTEAYRGQPKPQLRNVGNDLLDISDPSNPRMVYRAPMAGVMPVTRPDGTPGYAPKQDVIDNPGDYAPPPPSGASTKRINVRDRETGQVLQIPLDEYDADRGRYDVITNNRTTGSQAMPVGALKMMEEARDAIDASATIEADLGAFIGQIDRGELDFGPISNLSNRAANFTGFSDAESRNFGSFMNSLEKLRNDSLRLNKGVQTEGDSQRAWNELVNNLNDPRLVRQRLKEIRAINTRAKTLQAKKINRIRGNYGMEADETLAGVTVSPAVGSGGDDLQSMTEEQLLELERQLSGGR